jgi:endoglucanase
MRMRKVSWSWLALVGLGAAVMLVGLSGGASGSPPAQQARLCSLSSSARPILDPRPPAGQNPLAGAQFFVDGPGTNRGLAASAIAHEIGRSADSFGDISWPQFRQYVDSRHLSAGVAHRVHLLEKIGEQAEVKRFSVFSAGGGPGAINSQVQKLLCRMQRTDPTTDALISTYFLKHGGSCRSLRETNGDQAVFRRHIDELASAVGSFPSLILLESDAVDTSPCLSSAGLADREKLLSYAIDKLSKLPHTIVYVDGGTEDAQSPQFAAKVLNKIHVQKIRGFFVNATHFNWTTDEINYSEKISHLTHGAHFIIGTQVNGQGPLLNPHPVTQGTENLCNPRGRGLGPRPTSQTAYFNHGVDGFMWVGVPGRSAGHCGAGRAPAGSFDEGYALMLASNANGRLGKHFPSRPY